MSEHTSFIEIFPGCADMKDLCGGLDKAYVTDVAVSAADMIMNISAHFERMPAPAEISNICEKLRRDYGFNAVELVPEYPQPKSAPAPAGVKPKADDDKPSGKVLMGRAIKKSPVPMSTLTLDSGNVVIEGDVFDVTSRKLTKRDGAVLCFDITDRTGSIRVSRYLRADDDQSIINAIKEGDHLFISGVVNYSRYDEDMALAANTLIECGGGMCAVADGKVLAVVPLPIAGLMNDLHANDMAERVAKLDSAWKEMGCNIKSPYMTMALVPLACLPELRLTNRGLVDCRTFSFADLFC